MLFFDSIKHSLQICNLLFFFIHRILIFYLFLQLTIQFDDKATSTFEYPSENASPSPMEENGSSEPFDSSVAIDSSANSSKLFYKLNIL